MERDNQQRQKGDLIKIHILRNYAKPAKTYNRSHCRVGFLAD